ncbi:22577_t:CDS:2, partial [Gigaspora margarita]
MPQIYTYRLTKYVYVQDKLSPNQTTKQAICKACKSKEQIFEKEKNEGLEFEFWINEDQKVIIYKDPNENMACNTIR